MPSRASTPERQPRVVVARRAAADGRALGEALARAGFAVRVVQDTDAAVNAVGGGVEGVVCDARAPRLDGLVINAEALRASRWTCVVLITDGSSHVVALEAVRRGAYECFAEPVDTTAVVAALGQGIDRQRLARRVSEVEDQLDRRAGIQSLAGTSRAIQRVRETVRRAADVRTTVLIEGEAGTGKSMVARAIHHAGPRREKPFERVRCSALPEGLLELELFGSRGVPGAIERAEGGVLFLDGIEHVSHALQARLLWFLDNGRFERADESRERRADVRVIASSEQALETLARERRLHRELVSRLEVLRLTLPTLRDRLEDLPELVAEFVRAANREHRKRVPGVTPGVLDRLAHHVWPGNVRELRQVVHALVATARGRTAIDVDRLPEPLRRLEPQDAKLRVSVGMTLAAVERRLIEATLEHTGGDKPRAAAMLGIGLRTLYRRLDEWTVE